MDVNETKLNEDSEFKAVISLNNVKNLAEGQFIITNFGNASLVIKSIEATKELHALVGSSEEISIQVEKEYDESVKYLEQFHLSFNLPEGIKNLDDELALFDVEFEVEEFRGVGKDLMDDEQFLYSTLSAQDGLFKDSKGETLDIKTGTLNHSFDLESVNRTLIYGSADFPVSGLSGGDVVAIAPDGTEYGPTYTKLVDRSYLFTFNELPIIEGDYRLVYTMPNAFNSVLTIPGSKTNADGEVVGNLFGGVAYTFTGLSPLSPVLGDVNEDGAIDVVDAYLVGQEYVAAIPEVQGLSNSNADITQDGIVDYYDMYFVTANYLKQDLTRSDAKIPEDFYNGYDLYDILEACGYFDEHPWLNVILELSHAESMVGDQVTLTAIPPVDGIEFEYEFSIREASDTEWMVIKEKGEENSYVWSPEKAGDYAVKVRIFYDEINYVWQDNQSHVVHAKPYSIPSELQGVLDSNY